MALYRTVKASERLPDNGNKTIWIDTVTRREISSTAAKSAIRTQQKEFISWLEHIEPSPDIQKRAEELWPVTEGLLSYDMREKDRNKAIQLATEAVAAEREKYEKEIEAMGERTALAEAKIKAMQDAMLYMQQAAKVIAKL